MAERRGMRIPEPDPERLALATELAERAPVPARLGSVRAGTAGWTDPTLVKSGSFYPRGTSSSEARLRHYASHFSLVEVDATYYTLLPPEVAERWIATTPDDFLFDVKAHPVITGHPIDVTRMPKDLKDELIALGHERRVYPDKLPPALYDEIESRFCALLSPLQRAKRLGVVLAQFPPWFSATRGNAKQLERMAERLSGVQVGVEFRNRTWLVEERRERVLDLLRRLGLVYVCVDEPDIGRGSVPSVVTATHPELAIVRFHGKNQAGWAKKGASVHERFDYLYRPDELKSWIEPVRRLSREAHEVHLVFNNCVRNYAVLGAKDLVALLDQEGLGTST